MIDYHKILAVLQCLDALSSLILFKNFHMPFGSLVSQLYYVGTSLSTSVQSKPNWRPWWVYVSSFPAMSETNVIVMLCWGEGFWNSSWVHLFRCWLCLICREEFVSFWESQFQGDKSLSNVSSSYSKSFVIMPEIKFKDQKTIGILWSPILFEKDLRFYSSTICGYWYAQMASFRKVKYHRSSEAIRNL